MKGLLCVGLVCAAALFAQSTSDNVANDALRKRVLGMDLLKPPLRPTLQKFPAAMAPRACSIPLRNAIPAAPQVRIQPATPGVKPLLPSNPLPQVTPSPAVPNVLPQAPQARVEPGVIQPSIKPIPGDIVDYPAPPCDPR